MVLIADAIIGEIQEKWPDFTVNQQVGIESTSIYVSRPYRDNNSTIAILVIFADKITVVPTKAMNTPSEFTRDTLANPNSLDRVFEALACIIHEHD